MSADCIDWPLLINKIRRGLINHTFGMVRKYANGNPKPHQGWDFHALVGNETYALADGRVEFVKINQGDYGTQVCMSFKFNGTPLYAFYAHLQHVYVMPEQPVSLGTALGTTGDTGNAQGMGSEDQHLHFEIRLKKTCGLGLEGRVSPIEVFGICPLKAAQLKKYMYCVNG